MTVTPRLAACGVLAGVLSATSLAFAQSPPPGRETTAASVAGLCPVAEHAGRSGSRGRHAAERAALLRPRQRQARPPRRAAARRQGRLGPGRRRPAGPRALRRAHAVRGHAAFPGPEHRRFSVVARPEHRRGRQCGDELRRHAVHAARADRLARRARSRAARAGGLGAAARRSIKPASITSAASCLSEWRMHLGAGERTAGQDPARADGRIALRGSGRQSAIRTSSRTRSGSS